MKIVTIGYSEDLAASFSMRIMPTAFKQKTSSKRRSRPDRPGREEKPYGMEVGSIWVRDPQAARVPWGVRAPQSLYLRVPKHTGTPGTPLGPGGSQKKERKVQKIPQSI